MFGRDPYMPLNQLISQARRYLGTDEGIPDLEALQNLLQMTTTQIEYAAKWRNQNFKPVKPHNFQVGDLVLVTNHTSKVFQEKYQDSFCVVRLLGKNQLEVKDQTGHVWQVHITDVKKTTMAKVIAKAVPDYTQFGRATKLRLNPNYVEDLQWTIPKEFPKLPKEPDSEVSVLQLHTSDPSILSQITLTPECKYVLTKTQGKSWFWSITEKFKEGLSRWVSSADTTCLPSHSDQPL